MKLYNLFGMDTTKQESTRRGPAQAFMNNEKYLREEASKLAVKEREEEQRWIAKLQGTSLSSGSSTRSRSPASLSPSGIVAPLSIRLARTKLDSSVLPHRELPLRMTRLLFHPHQCHLSHRKTRVKALL